MRKQTPPFIPIGDNAKNVPAFNNLVGGKYIGKYIVIYRHFFKFALLDSYSLISLRIYDFYKIQFN